MSKDEPLFKRWRIAYVGITVLPNFVTIPILHFAGGQGECAGGLQRGAGPKPDLPEGPGPSCTTPRGSGQAPRVHEGLRGGPQGRSQTHRGQGGRGLGESVYTSEQ